MIVVFRYVFLKGYVGLSLWPFIILRHPGLRRDDTLINHEKIHLRQQLETGILPFYVFYILEWLIRLLWYRNAYQAYQNLSFEREAFLHESDPDYLQHRRPYRFLKYLWKPEPQA